MSNSPTTEGASLASEGNEQYASYKGGNHHKQWIPRQTETICCAPDVLFALPAQEEMKCFGVIFPVSCAAYIND